MVKIRALFIYEILGRPAEYIKKALEELLARFDNQKGIKVESKRIHEPKACESEDAKDLFTTFAEIEMTIDNLELLFSIVHNTLPSTIEIIQPDEITLKNFELNSVISELIVKLHKYDEVAKIVNIQKANLINIINQLQEENEKLRGPVKVEEIINPLEQTKEKKDKKALLERIKGRKKTLEKIKKKKS